MNAHSNAMHEPFDSEMIPPAVMAATRPLYWSIRREIWENRAIYIAPLAVAGLTLLGFLIASMGAAMSTHNVARRAILADPYTFAAGAIMATTFIVSIFYCLDALHGERRDRSILFWKSLPVSDTTTVLAKASIPFVVLPAITFALTFATHWIMLLVSSAFLLGSGLSAAALWRQLSAFQISLLYHLVTVHVLWYAPLFAWMMLVSGWARRAAFLWATLPLFAIAVVEKITFNSTHFTDLLKYRFSGPEVFDFSKSANVFAMDPMMHLSLGRFLSTPGLWSGLVVAALFLWAAVRLRRYREPI
jgi:ABC-2 type transport system permease protein